MREWQDLKSLLLSLLFDEFGLGRGRFQNRVARFAARLGFLLFLADVPVCHTAASFDAAPRPAGPPGAAAGLYR